MSEVDVLIATALDMERDALRSAMNWRIADVGGSQDYKIKDREKQPEYWLGDYALPNGGGSLTIAVARPIRMAGNFMSNTISSLMERLEPRCLAMCGVCAGNPTDFVLGDVAIANTVFQYDEGKRTTDGFHADLFPIPMDVGWVQRAKDLRPNGLPSYGIASESDSSLWLLEQLYAGNNPAKNTARNRFFPPGTWEERISRMESHGLLRRKARTFVITAAGKEFVDRKLAYSVDPPLNLPFVIKVGPMASGNAVVKDGLTWDMLKRNGERSAIALEMEAASIGAASYSRSSSKWIVVKGVMDHADPRKDDRYKPFAARASAEVLLRFLEQTVDTIRSDDSALCSTPPSGRRPSRSAHVVDLSTTERQRVRDNLAKLLSEHHCANLVVSGELPWRDLIDDLVKQLQWRTSIVDLHDPETTARDDLVKTILWKFGIEIRMSSPKEDLKLLSRHISTMDCPLIIIYHFDAIQQWTIQHRKGLLAAFSFLVQKRRVSILVQTRAAFHTLVPESYEYSWFRPEAVELKPQQLDA